MIVFFVSLAAFVFGYILGFLVCEHTIGQGGAKERLKKGMYFNGSASHIEIYDRALSWPEIKNLYQRKN